MRSPEAPNRRLLAIALAVVFVVTACSSGDDEDDGGGRSTTTAGSTTTEGPVELEGDITLGDLEAPDRCDPLDPRHCLLPFPSDTFTVADDETDTGRRVELARESMPVNANGVRVDPTEWNRNDGFSPGQPISLQVPGLDFEGSGIVPLTDIGASLDDDAPVVLLDATAGERHPYWAEVDASVDSDADRVLYIRPAVNYPEGHRMVIALRGLTDSAGEAIEAGDVFRAYRDRLAGDVPEVEARRDRYEQVFADLAGAGVERADLYLAWDFTVASERNLSERILHIRDDAFAALGDAAPAFTVEQVEDDSDSNVARRVTGTFEVPLYLTGSGEPGSRFNTGSDGLPQRNGDATYPASFICNIPSSAWERPARAVVYGHGLLGGNDEVNAGNVRDMGDEHNFVFCATNWIGMSEEDIPNAAAILQDISLFSTLADRSQQGILNTLFLARLMKHEQGLVSHEAFQDAAGDPVIATGEVFYDGNSQGAIMGGAATAVSTEWTAAVLGVPGMNYSTLLQRSVDWDTYKAVYEPSYPDQIERGIGISLIQMLWDRAESNGYAQHLTDDPLPGTPEHRILLHVAVGDWQVSTYAAEVEARTAGAHLRVPGTSEGRHPDVEPHWGIDPIESYPYEGSAIVFWDSGSPAPPMVNLAPSEGRDSHEDPRRDVEVRRQKSEFLQAGGAVIDVCPEGEACTVAPSD